MPRAYALIDVTGNADFKVLVFSDRAKRNTFLDKTRTNPRIYPIKYDSVSHFAHAVKGKREMLDGDVMLRDNRKVTVLVNAK